jgi:hypothetical protein
MHPAHARDIASCLLAAIITAAQGATAFAALLTIEAVFAAMFFRLFLRRRWNENFAPQTRDGLETHNTHSLEIKLYSSKIQVCTDR